MQRTGLPNNQQAAEVVAREFHRLYGEHGRVFAAPGRVNLIGEHTDYNDGFVMPAAIAFYTFVAASARSDNRLSVYSVDFQESREFDLEELTPGPTGNWS